MDIMHLSYLIRVSKNTGSGSAALVYIKYFSGFAALEVRGGEIFSPSNRNRATTKNIFFNIKGDDFYLFGFIVYSSASAEEDDR